MAKFIITDYGFWQSYVAKSNIEIIDYLVKEHQWRLQPVKYLDSLLSDTTMADSHILFFPDAQGKHTRSSVFKHANALQKHKGLVGVVIDDLHSWKKENEKIMLACKIVFANFPDKVKSWYPKVWSSKKVVDFPHSAASVFTDVEFNKEPKNTLFLSGSQNHRWYPMRKMAVDACRSHNISHTLYKHPGYERLSVQQEERAGQAYAKAIGEHVAAFTCGMCFGNLLRKHFEIPATGALLIAHDSTAEQMKAKYMIPGRHYLAFSDERSFIDAIKYALDPSNRKEIDRIRRNGKEVVKYHHTTQLRASLLDNYFESTCCVSHPNREGCH